MSSSTSCNRAVDVPELDITLKASSSRTLDGLPLFLTATALTASLIPYPSMWQVVGLGALWFLTLFGGKR